MYRDRSDAGVRVGELCPESSGIADDSEVLTNEWMILVDSLR